MHVMGRLPVFSLSIFLVLLQLLAHGTSQESSSDFIDAESLANYCIDSKNHKSAPGPEDELHSQCTPWKDNACCTSNTTVHAHGGKLYGFNYDHCPGHKMSDKCREHFIQDLCFYECSPNVGPWRQSVSGMKMRTERFYQVPLCASDCDAWFEACRDDWTCTDNWSRNFNWKEGKNVCPPDAQCHTFAEVYVNSSNFCQRVWDDSWKYTSDSDHCMRIWFDGSQGNPNDAVTRWKIKQLQALNGSGSLRNSFLFTLSVITTLTMTWLL